MEKNSSLSDLIFKNELNDEKNINQNVQSFTEKRKRTDNEYKDEEDEDEEEVVEKLKDTKKKKKKKTVEYFNSHQILKN